MRINTEIDISGAVDLANRVLKKFPYATNTALAQVGKEIVEAERAELAREFQIRKQFFLNRVRIMQYPRANNLVLVVGIDKQVQGGALLLTEFEQGGTKTPTAGPELAVPITGGPARPSFSESIPRSLLYKQLQMEKHITKRGRAQYKGKRHTFIIDGVGIFQRTGPGKNDIELIYKFKTSAQLRQRMRFRAIAQQIFRERFRVLWNQAFISELTHK
jgi:hypothetical protein